MIQVNNARENGAVQLLAYCLLRLMQYGRAARRLYTIRSLDFQIPIIVSTIHGGRVSVWVSHSPFQEQRRDIPSLLYVDMSSLSQLAAYNISSKMHTVLAFN